MSRFSCTAVASSLLDIWKPPSPMIVQTLQVRSSDLGPNGGRQAEAHGAQAARGDPAVGVIEPEMLSGPHLVLAHVRGHDRVTVRGLRDRLDDGVWLWPIWPILQGLTQGAVLLRIDPGCPVVVAALLDLGISSFNTSAASPSHRHIRVDILADFRRVDVDMHHSRVLGEASPMRPVARSSKRAPMLTSRSHVSRASLTCLCPCMPIRPRPSG